jgi:hypothetical protein
MSESTARFNMRNSLITIAAIVVGLAFAVLMLPRGFSDDLSKIGGGANVALLVHNKNGVQSQEVMDLLNAVRADYAGKVEFVVADIDADPGKAFVREQQVGDSVLVFYGPDGKRRGAVQRIKNEAELRMALDTAFDLVR